MDIKVNEDLIYSKFDNPLYAQIPPTLRSFVEKNLCSYGDGIQLEKGKVTCDLELDGSDYYVIMPTNRAKNKVMEISNWLNEYEKIQEYGVEIPNAEENYNKLLKYIEDIGYKFQFAWDGNEYDSTYKLIVPINEFDEEKVFQCLKIWEDYDKVLEEYINKI